MTDQAPPDPAEPIASTTRIFVGPEGLRPGWAILLFLILVAAFGSATNFLAAQLQSPSPRHATSSAQTSPAHLLASESASLLAVLLATSALARIEHRPVSSYGLGGTRKLPLFLQGLLWGAASLSLLVAVLGLSGSLHFDTLLLHGPAAFGYAILWAIGFTLVAFFEETLLRGYLQYTLARALTSVIQTLSNTPNRQAYGFWLAALLLSVLFGLSHTTNPGESPLGLFAAACAGLLFCFSLYRTGSLWWVLGFHTAWDWSQSFLYGVADSGTAIQNHLLATHPTGNPLLSGGATGPEGSLFVLPTLALVAAIIRFTTPAAPHTGSPSDPALAPSSAAYRH